MDLSLRKEYLIAPGQQVQSRLRKECTTDLFGRVGRFTRVEIKPPAR
jgi:hypothetical protein